jgi:hypothetical protein
MASTIPALRPERLHRIAVCRWLSNPAKVRPHPSDPVGLLARDLSQRRTGSVPILQPATNRTPRHSLMQRSSSPVPTAKAFFRSYRNNLRNNCDQPELQLQKLLREIWLGSACIDPSIAPPVPKGSGSIRPRRLAAVESVEISFQDFPIIQLPEFRDGSNWVEFSHRTPRGPV